MIKVFFVTNYISDITDKTYEMINDITSCISGDVTTQFIELYKIELDDSGEFRKDINGLRPIDIIIDNILEDLSESDDVLFIGPDGEIGGVDITAKYFTKIVDRCYLKNRYSGREAIVYSYKHNSIITIVGSNKSLIDEIKTIGHDNYYIKCICHLIKAFIDSASSLRRGDYINELNLHNQPIVVINNKEYITSFEETVISAFSVYFKENFGKLVIDNNNFLDYDWSDYLKDDNNFLIVSIITPETNVDIQNEARNRINIILQDIDTLEDELVEDIISYTAIDGYSIRVMYNDNSHINLDDNFCSLLGNIIKNNFIK